VKLEFRRRDYKSSAVTVFRATVARYGVAVCYPAIANITRASGGIAIAALAALAAVQRRRGLLSRNRRVNGICEIAR